MQIPTLIQILIFFGAIFVMIIWMCSFFFCGSEDEERPNRSKKPKKSKYPDFEMDLGE